MRPADKNRKTKNNEYSCHVEKPGQSIDNLIGIERLVGVLGGVMFN